MLMAEKIHGDIEPGRAPGPDEAARWAALARRDAGADGLFVYSVRTTGVYCRPSCRARRARPENVAFHPTCEAAEAAGFRPCRRCRPNEPSRRERRAEIVARACRTIETAETVPALADLARSAGLSAFHFHRVFKEVAGVTPAAYADARRAARAASELQRGSSVTEAVYEAGFNAPSRFYASAGARLGMAPRAYRDGGAGAAIRYAATTCYLGAILVAATERGICAILLGDDGEALVADLRARFPKAEIGPGDGDFERVVAEVVGFVEAPGRGLDLPLDIGGTAFQQRVWDALRRIPAGSTASYADIARAIGAPAAVRAVAQACGANGIAVAIPCHRIVRSDGALSGYRFGVERKRRLLAREGGAR
ncbi:bifunctional DNA-binding transcriptional regulator/O6-methylguanine-DNA methyltransferase Ada [Methylobacterium oxalidis]|uniref:methylated-DNA--[protein]-cysteine S-methyltransferase n=1 Tax=Methylobacterium oxalidis TaxID=944322 RepID=A0A512J0H3_9HYPH|nr:bifunctional DNA-binding transcriptional regulator/O6-methylguanine-DNA methyltransferase Ada [Methylobacterium oxalidis]GEP03379.1 bifunctional transcriptional activator/DNA repair enzyme protein Ada [Methylobacterium oxalidis]GJE33037.1 Bifunctional transcriptional activator/DNA repair enzyme Ada [Methylobacterium oxalidis]GLS63426.1 bifunctional transcriptional activator/DNA repair enzyme protein Ada [Methylobacterium oxalidis]